jgi:hypothetical protein
MKSSGNMEIIKLKLKLNTEKKIFKKFDAISQVDIFNVSQKHGKKINTTKAKAKSFSE